LAEVDKGTTIKVVFPVSHEYIEKVDSQRDDGQAWRESGTILVVDVEESIRNLVGMMLEGHRFNVITACVGLEWARIS